MRTRKRSGREGVGFGILLMSLGVLFLLDRFGVVELREFWRWWPLWTIAWGLVKIAAWESAERVGGGVTFVLLGLWFLCATMEWYGLGWHNSWPLAFVAIGGGMVFRGLIAPTFYPREGEGGPKNVE